MNPVIPTCKVHNAPMITSNKFPGFYCPKKLDDGSWCRERAKSPEGAAPQVAPAAPQVTFDRKDARVAAALNFAGRIYQGTAGESEQAALLLAERALLMFERKL